MAEEINFPLFYEKNEETLVIEEGQNVLYAGPEDPTGVTTHRWEVSYDYSLSLEENIELLKKYIDENYQ